MRSLGSVPNCPNLKAHPPTSAHNMQREKTMAFPLCAQKPKTILSILPCVLKAFPVCTTPHQQHSDILCQTAPARFRLCRQTGMQGRCSMCDHGPLRRRGGLTLYYQTAGNCTHSSGMVSLRKRYHSLNAHVELVHRSTEVPSPTSLEGTRQNTKCSVPHKCKFHTLCTFSSVLRSTFLDTHKAMD